MRFLIRADASAQSGTGHVMRVLGLAQGLQRHGHGVNFLHRCPQSLRRRLEVEGFPSVDIKAVPGTSRDAIATIRYAMQMDASWIIADGYSFGASYQREIRDANLRLLLVDDNGDADGYIADLVLNQSLHAEPTLYGKSYDDRRFLLGGEYVLLRAEFHSWIGHERQIAQIPQTVLVSLGGLPDPDWLTKVVTGVAGTGMEVCIAGGIAPSSQGRFDLNVSVSVLPNVEDMAELIARCDIGITAGGGTTREFLFLGLPFAVVDVAENQILQSRFLADEGLALRLGPIETLQAVDVDATVRSLASNTADRRRMSEAGQAHIDGLGVERVIERLVLQGGDDGKS